MQKLLLKNFLKPAMLLLFALLLVSVLAQGQQPGAIDPSFNPTDLGFGNGDAANQAVYTIAIQPNGKIMIGGRFNTYNGTTRNRIARLNADGSLDATFNPLTGANGDVKVIVVQTDGKILIGGDFTSYNGVSRARVARLNGDGTLDTTFDPGAGVDGSVVSLVVQPDGKIIIGGSFSTVNGITRWDMGRLNSDGSLDTSLDPPNIFFGSSSIFSISLQSNGKIIAGGNFDKGLVRLNSDGSQDATFNTGTGTNYYANGPGAVYTTIIQADGKIFIGGAFQLYNGISRNKTARINADGSLDLTFIPDVTNYWYDIRTSARQSDGKIIIAGNFYVGGNYSSLNIYKIARLNNNGTLDTGYNPGSAVSAGTLNSTPTISSIALQPDGKLVYGGDFLQHEGARNKIARLNSNATIDASFNPSTGIVGNVNNSSSVGAIAQQADGKIILGGSFASYNGILRKNLIRTNPNGSLDNTFNTGGAGPNSSVVKIVIQPDGKILISGWFTHYNGVARNYIARLNSDGTLDTSFNPGSGLSGGPLDAIALQPDGKILIGGGFTVYNGVNVNNIARLNPDGSIDTGFNIGTGANSSVFTIAVQPDGKIFVGGYFTEFNGTSRDRMIRLNSDGSRDQSFANNYFCCYVFSAVVQPDGKILIGGDFTSSGAISKYIARMNANGTWDTGFNTGVGANDDVRTVLLQTDGKIIITGEFTTYNGVARSRIARLNANGSLDTSFDPGSGTVTGIYASALQTDGNILIGSDFTSYNGTGRNRIARINGGGSANSTPTDISLSATAINENVASNTTVGTFSSTDTDAGDTHTYSLVTGTGSTDNAAFNISGNALRITTSPDYEVKNSYSIRVRTTDQAGAWFEKVFNIAINDVLEAPTITSFTPTSGPIGTTITITGTNFTGVMAVRVGSTSNSFTVNSTTQITTTLDGQGFFRLAAGLPDGPITVMTSGGSATSSTYFTLTSGSSPSITTDPIVPASGCQGGPAYVPFTTTGTFNAGNVFTAQLVSSTGLRTPVTLGSVSSTSSGSIWGTIPFGTLGQGYDKIRVIASDPVTTGTTTDFMIQPSVDYYEDTDRDGFYSSTPTNRCYAPLGINYQLTPGNDCNDFDNTIYPGAPEICDGKDNNCDGISDPAVVISTAPQTITSGQSVQLNATGASSYSWSSSPAGFSSTSATPTVSPTVTTTYTVTGNGSGCNTSASVTITVQAPAATVSLSADTVTGLPGTQVVVPIRVRNFKNMLTAQGTINFNTSVATLTPADIVQFGLPGLASSSFDVSTPGRITYSWDDATQQGLTLPDNAIIFALRFNVVGTLGTSTPVSFVNTPTITEYTNTSFSAVNVITTNGSITVPANYLTTSALGSSSICAGSTVNVPFNAGGIYMAGNTFTAQLSDTNGSFASPVTIGTLSATSSGSITATIPTGTVPGTGYRIRVIASAPALVGSGNGSDLTINAVPVAPTASNVNSCGSSTVTLTAAGAPAGGFYQWYYTATGGSPIAGETGATITVLAMLPSVTYYVSVVNSSGCESARTSVTGTTVNAPTPPTASGSRCGPGTVALMASSGIPGATYQWYTAASGGTPISTAPMYITPFITTTTTYYVSVVSIEGCESARVPALAIINPLPYDPTTTGASSCGPGTVMLMASGGAPTDIRWYSDSVGGTIINYGPTFYTPVLATTTTYYVSVVSIQGCESGRTPVTATINAAPSAPVATSNSPLAAGSTLNLSASFVTGAVYSWTGPNGFTSTLQNPSILNVTSANAGIYSVTASVNGCISLAGTVTVSVTLSVAGIVRAESNAPINTVSLTAAGGGNPIQNYTTTSNGAYSFTLGQTGNYTVSAAKSNDVMANNGVTTLDIALIRRHILGVQLLGSPYKLLAADVDASNAVSTADIAQIRSLILTTTSSFNGQQWKFVPASYVFGNPANPFPAPAATLTLNGLSTSLTNQDFIGMKLGDVNNTWDNTIARLAVAGNLGLNVPQQNTMPGSLITVPVRVKDFNNVSGYQFTLNWDPQVLTFDGINNIGTTGAFGTHQVANGKLTTSWDNTTGSSTTLADGSTLFEVRFRVIGATGAVSPINITSDLTQEVAYDNNLDQLNIVAGNGQVRIGSITGLSETETNGYALYQNWPNPFSQQTSIGFSLPKAEEVTLIVYNNLGQVVAKHSGKFGAGEHQISWDQLQLKSKLSAGTYFYQLSSGKFSATKRMVFIAK